MRYFFAGLFVFMLCIGAGLITGILTVPILFILTALGQTVGTAWLLIIIVPIAIIILGVVFTRFYQRG